MAALGCMIGRPFQLAVSVLGRYTSSSIASFSVVQPLISGYFFSQSEISNLSPISVSTRQLSTTSYSLLKEIVQEVDGNKVVIEGKYVESSNKPLLVHTEFAEKKVCSLCALNLNIKHTDVLLLSQFVKPNGQILPRRITGICCSQQHKITMLITMSKKAGLMPNLGPANSHKDPSKRRGSNKYHRYFDESTISDTRMRNIIKYKPIGIGNV